jgi:hypothetical protein
MNINQNRSVQLYIDLLRETEITRVISIVPEAQ